MDKAKPIINLLDRDGFRRILSFIVARVLYYKTGEKDKIYYDQNFKKWIQRNNKLVYYVNFEPNWNICYQYLEKYVKENHFLQYNPQIGDVIIDIGAGIGTETIIYSSKVGESGKVFAVEAHPETFESLKILCELNSLKNVIISNIAISDYNGVVYIESRQNHAENKIFKESEKGDSIPVTTFDEYINKNKITKINFLKINIEGAEKELITKMTTSICMVNYIAISCHDFLFENNNFEIKNSVIEFLKSNNFNIIERQTGHIAWDSWIFGINKKFK